MKLPDNFQMREHSRPCRFHITSDNENNFCPNRLPPLVLLTIKTVIGLLIISLCTSDNENNFVTTDYLPLVLLTMKNHCDYPLSLLVLLTMKQPIISPCTSDNENNFCDYLLSPMVFLTMKTIFVMMDYLPLYFWQWNNWLSPLVLLTMKTIFVTAYYLPLFFWQWEEPIISLSTSDNENMCPKGSQASPLTYFSTCPFGQLTKTRGSQEPVSFTWL